MSEVFVHLRMEKIKNEIRIYNMNNEVFKQVKELARINKRSVSKQAEFMIETALVDIRIDELKDNLKKQ